MSSVVSPPENHIFLENIRWSTYLALLADLGEHRGRLTYDRGALEIVSPSKKHEHLERLLGRLIEAFTEELDIKVQSVSSTTLNREDLQRGVEADECYYVENEPAVRHKEEIDLERDPPPDPSGKGGVPPAVGVDRRAAGRGLPPRRLPDRVPPAVGVDRRAPRRVSSSPRYRTGSPAEALPPGRRFSPVLRPIRRRAAQEKESQRVHGIGEVQRTVVVRVGGVLAAKGR
jgi:hypothetical protein